MLVPGCTKIVGLDGEYVALDVSSTGGRTGSQGGATGGESAGGRVQTGGASTGTGGRASGTGGSLGTGGIMGAGGTSSTASGGDPGTGGAEPVDAAPGDAPVGPPPSGCGPGLYTGSFNGVHAPSFTVVGVPLPLKGTLEIRFIAGPPNTILIGSGTMDGDLALPSGFTSFHATLAGSYDCASNQFVGSTLTGSFGSTAQTTGTITGSFSSGSWHEQESLGPAYSGSGTFSVAWTSP